MDDIVKEHPNIPESKKVSLFVSLRLAKNFADFKKRLQLIQARLQSLSILIYSKLVFNAVLTLL